MKQNKNHNINRIIYIILNLFQVAVLGFSLMIYTSLNKRIPWYEGSGMQFLAILIISVPLLLIIGVSLKLLNKKYNISTLSRKLPFYASVLIAVPILLDGSLNRVLIGIGSWICVGLIILTIYFLAICTIRKIT